MVRAVLDAAAVFEAVEGGLTLEEGFLLPDADASVFSSSVLTAAPGVLEHPATLRVFEAVAAVGALKRDLTGSTGVFLPVDPAELDPAEAFLLAAAAVVVAAVAGTLGRPRALAGAGSSGVFASSSSSSTMFISSSSPLVSCSTGSGALPFFFVIAAGVVNLDFDLGFSATVSEVLEFVLETGPDALPLGVVALVLRGGGRGGSSSSSSPSSS